MEAIVKPGARPPLVLDLTPTQARLLRAYKRRILEPLVLKEKLYCVKCAERGDAEGVRAFVTEAGIEIRCRCTRRQFKGSSD